MEKHFAYMQVNSCMSDLNKLNKNNEPCFDDLVKFNSLINLNSCSAILIFVWQMEARFQVATRSLLNGVG